MNPEHSRSQGNDLISGRYANYFEVGQNAAEFVLDFGQSYAENERAHIHTRIITSPLHAKALLHILQESIERHEHVFGDIRDR